MIHRGDLFDVLPTLEAESIDACVTDPPYGLEFMGKEWDKLARPKAGHIGGFADGNKPSFERVLKHLPDMQAWHTRWAVEVIRVLKPGAHLLAFGGTRTFHRLTSGMEDAGFEIRDCLSWLYGQGFPKSLNLGDGRGTALKPSWEPIILARKPTRGTVAKNVAQHGTGALNIDACRIKGMKPATTRGAGGRNGVYSPLGAQGRIVDDGLGRWPANVVLDEEAAALLDEMTGELAPPGGPASVGTGTASWLGGGHPQGRLYLGESGGASRFYYVAKPSREERDYGCRGRNGHPTVKPVELMRWLVRLVTPPDGLVLDPFCGSGTTGMACRYELRRFVGIEREAEYADIAEARIAAVAPLFRGAI